MRRAAYRVRGCHVLCVRTHLHFLFLYFWQHFCLIVSCFFGRNLALSLFKKDIFVREGYFNFCRHEISFFY